MLFLLSPAKTLDYDTPVPADILAEATRPQYVDRAAELIGLLRPQTPAQVAALMDLSDPLATLNFARYAAWRPRHTEHNSKPAVLAFDGDVYDGLQAKTLSLADLRWAQQHLVILSGLYGLLRPLDRLQPYRLEMGTALRNPAGRDLYAYWGDMLAAHLNRLQRGQRAPVVVNLASQEYSRAALRPALKARVVECVFEDWKPGGWQIVSFFAKRARGAMARHAILNRIDSPEALAGFDAEGYAFDAGVSTPDRLVFRRRAA
ncbi:MAG: peroxide stress protein YaaA [Piscinibacter sp.]|uniref:peroxide stress protein YaaA n=1 Tax=Piscinibacter sp. TaxID=1903157 RepID=UPI002589C0B4|nr:peroxide stress protein YaaA [Piscinibacter sp.]MCW5664613.1 peroxide stress protein YaaA [Piscinibacter sp.]